MNYRIAIVGAGAIGLYYGGKNGLSILAGGIDTAVILADKDLHRSTTALMQEVIAAANQCGHALPIATAAEQMKRTETMGAQTLRLQVLYSLLKSIDRVRQAHQIEKRSP